MGGFFRALVTTAPRACVPRDFGVLVDLVFQLAEQGWANMDLKLIVLAGAKEGTQIPLKKEKFIIGRATECTLRAGSSAISRRHCAIVRKDGSWYVRDLGSRNGTFLNDGAVESPTALKVGDEIRVGPLHFRVDEYVPSAEGSKGPKSTVPAAAAAALPAEPPAPLDINRGKQPPAKTVSDVMERTSKQASGSTSEEDITGWLLGLEGGGGGNSMRETQTLNMEETTAIGRAVPTPETASSDALADDQSAEVPADEAAAQSSAEGSSDKADSGGWKFFKMGKKAAAKKAPGKLPPRPSELSKDSREAAADILREMTRRR
jgi:pSer/pThr/pTyr-binding forkhead associated (FHA) protein